SLPDNLVLTLPKVSTVDQVRAMVLACRDIEAQHGLAEGTVSFEIQVETPQLVLGADGTVPLASALHAGAGRVTSLPYGTYSCSAYIGVATASPAVPHPVDDIANDHLNLALAATGA